MWQLRCEKSVAKMASRDVRQRCEREMELMWIGVSQMQKLCDMDVEKMWKPSLV